MACRITEARFLAMAQQEADHLKMALVGLLAKDEDPQRLEGFTLCVIEEPGPAALLNRKAIQSLVDEPEQARPIIRNLLRWAKEHGAR